jgi:GNAT superfamily N-acetyltransferase
LYADRLAVFPEIARLVGVEQKTIVYTGVAITVERRPVGHVALRRTGADLELKRMYVAPRYRGVGVGKALLDAAEAAASRLGGRRVILQTGDRQPDAIRLYERAGYVRIPVFPPYEEVAFSHCLGKELATTTWRSI